MDADFTGAGYLIPKPENLDLRVKRPIGTSVLRSVP